MLQNILIMKIMSIVSLGKLTFPWALIHSFVFGPDGPFQGSMVFLLDFLNGSFAKKCFRSSNFKEGKLVTVLLF
jgi:hypothetical protein